VLFIRELPDGTVTQSWERADHVDLSRYGYPPRSLGANGRIVPASALSRPRDCDAENRQCINDCMDRPLPRGYGHITSNGTKGGKEAYCRNQCWQPYLDCVELQKLRPQEFTSVDDAVDWLRRHREMGLEGSIIVIAGVAFVVLIGPELIILAPFVLLAEHSVERKPALAGVSP
jgi:hypothetical protein